MSSRCLRGQGYGWTPLSHVNVAAEWLGNQAIGAERGANPSNVCGSNPQGCQSEARQWEVSETLWSAGFIKV